MVTDVMAKIVYITFLCLEFFVISWSVTTIFNLCLHTLHDDWKWQNDLETDKAKIKLGIKSTSVNLFMLLYLSVLHFLPDNNSENITSRIDTEELTWFIAFSIIFFVIYIIFFVKSKIYDKKSKQEDNKAKPEIEKGSDSK